MHVYSDLGNEHKQSSANLPGSVRRKPQMGNGSRIMMEFRQLKYFMSVAEAGSFSRAAIAIGVAQPALSRQIRLLEEQLKSALFYRTGRGAELTPAGELLFAYAGPALEANARAIRQIHTLGGSIHGSVTLGILPSLSPLLMKPLLKRLRSRYPDLNLHVREGMSGTLIDWLQNKKVDIATIYEPMGRNWCIAEHLLADNLYFIRRAGSQDPLPRSAEDLCNVGLALPGKQHGIRKLIEERMQECRCQLNVVYEIDSIPAIKDLVREEGLCTLLPRGAVEVEVRNGEFEIAAMDNPCFRRNLALATASSSSLDSGTRMVLQVIKQSVNEISTLYDWQIPRTPFPSPTPSN